MRLLALSAKLTVALSLSALASAATEKYEAMAVTKPCDLLSAGEIEDTLGEPVETGRLLDNGTTTDGASSWTCVWVAQERQGELPDSTRPFGGRAFTILNVMNWPGPAADSRKFLQSFRSSFEEGVIGTRPVEVAIGADEALWWGDGIAARRNHVSFGLSVASAGDRSERRPKAEHLARLVVRRLPDKPI